MKLRTVKNKSGGTGIQVVNYNFGKREILYHVGTGNNEREIEILKHKGNLWIQEKVKGTPLFKEKTIDENQEFKNNYLFTGVRLELAKTILNKLIEKFNFHKHIPEFLRNLLIGQVLESGSKRHLMRFLEDKMGIIFTETRVYEWFGKTQKDLVSNIQKEAVNFAKEYLGFDFSFVLYDVTTLYFESFKDYKLQKPGFSKDNKNNQPQIVIGLVVTETGFPVHYEVFEGNTFEGKTFLKIVKDFKTTHKIRTLTVVADAAMTSKLNISDLEDLGVKYILGARVLNMNKDLLEQIDKELKREDLFNLKINDNLIIEFSQKRFNKDKSDLEKYKKKAEKLVGIETTKLRKLKYLKNENTVYSLDENLIATHTKFLGIKGYVSNLTGKSNKEIIDYYHNLFKVEHAFRISKSDLEMRPIFHFKEESIRNHILLCFMALCISAYLEIKTKLSIKEIQYLLNSHYQIQITSKLTGKNLILDQELSPGLESILEVTH